MADYFLKVDGIEGESVDDKHPNEIDVLSWNWGVNRPEDGGLLGTGRAQAAKDTVRAELN
ncbi:MAG: hypothetical protein GEU75_17675 [Dehalococcoidia bacterium]|nr:hypothetical protein [Dehalococcoidia bacterium]